MCAIDECRACRQCGEFALKGSDLCPECQEAHDAETRAYRASEQESMRAARVQTQREERHDVLCQCGWGILACPESQLPDECPVCGFDFAAYATGVAS